LICEIIFSDQAKEILFAERYRPNKFPFFQLQTGMWPFYYKCNRMRLRLLAACSIAIVISKMTLYSTSAITITLKVITIRIAIAFVLKYSQKENKTHFRGFRKV